MMSKSAIALVVCVLTCAILEVASNIQYPNIDEETGCPLNVPHVCEYCAEDQNRLGCYCETDSGDFIVTANVFTPCRAENADPCRNHSCLNGATCVQEGLSGYRCECSAGFSGPFCADPLARCDDPDIVCNNAECVETTNPALPVYCQCFDGSRRDPRRNETCPLSPCFQRDSEEPVCRNNGTCRIVNNAYVCECASGFAGTNCTRALATPLCESQPGVCGVGKCVQSLTPPFYSCNCGAFPSTFGRTITELVKCEASGCYASNPCQNGGTCSNRANGAFLCQCPVRYTGSKCERQSACFNNPCLNGATCEAFNETVYFCKCPPYFTGQRCEVAVANPCLTKSCGPFGTCRDIQGVAFCYCNNATFSDATACEDPCNKISCGAGVCARRTTNTSIEAYCTCPVTRTGPLCELPTDKCRQAPRCGGGYCKTDYSNPRGYHCVCEGNVVRTDPCPFGTNCPIRDCGTKGICTETDGLIPTPGSRPIYYVCTCLNGYITTRDCNNLIDNLVPAARIICGANGTPYPSRNPNNPIGCWCNNGTHIEEIMDSTATNLC